MEATWSQKRWCALGYLVSAASLLCWNITECSVVLGLWCFQSMLALHAHCPGNFKANVQCLVQGDQSGRSKPVVWGDTHGIHSGVRTSNEGACNCASLPGWHDSFVCKPLDVYRVLLNLQSNNLIIWWYTEQSKHENNGVHPLLASSFNRWHSSIDHLCTRLTSNRCCCKVQNVFWSCLPKHYASIAQPREYHAYKGIC